MVTKTSFRGLGPGLTIGSGGTGGLEFPRSVLRFLRTGYAMSQGTAVPFGFPLLIGLKNYKNIGQQIG